MTVRSLLKVLQALFTRVPLQMYSTTSHAAPSWLFLPSLRTSSPLGVNLCSYYAQRTFANLEEDVETEDAWEIASRRASVISRRPSHHSIRFPYHTDAAAGAHSGSGIGFGAAAASVDELLGGGSGTASDESGMGGSAPLARQVTAVQETRGREDGGDVDMPEALPEEDDGGGISPGLGDDPDCLGSLAILTDPTMLDRSYSNSNSGQSTGIPIAPEVRGGEGATLMNGRTPMDFAFLSTLAAGVSERLNAGEAGLMGRTPVVEEGNGSGEVAGENNVEPRSNREGRRSRGDIDMMFS